MQRWYNCRIRRNIYDYFSVPASGVTEMDIFRLFHNKLWTVLENSLGQLTCKLMSDNLKCQVKSFQLSFNFAPWNIFSNKMHVHNHIIIFAAVLVLWNVFIWWIDFQRLVNRSLIISNILCTCCRFIRRRKEGESKVPLGLCWSAVPSRPYPSSVAQYSTVIMEYLATEVLSWLLTPPATTRRP